MFQLLKNAWARFKSDVPATERKLQLIMVAASAAFASTSAIAWPGKFAIIGTISGYVAAACAGMGFLLQFAMQAQVIALTNDQVIAADPTTGTINSNVLPIN